MEYKRLNNGITIPKLGIGGFGQSENTITDALKIGYRLIDTAAQYKNETEIGYAIKNSGIPRRDIFLTTKLWTDDIRKRRTKKAFEESLHRLNTDYIDLYLIHWPAEGYVEAWEEMETLYAEGRVRAIGVSNFHKSHLESLKASAKINPAVNQVETHPYFNNWELIEFCHKNDIAPEGWCPLGGAHGKDMVDERLLDIARRKQKTVAQIIIRWHLQRDVIVFPKTKNWERLQSNIQVFDFILSDKEMKEIDNCNTGKRVGADPENFTF